MKLLVLDELEIEVTKTANGQNDYVQIRSPAAIPVNIVLVANKITVKDERKREQGIKT